MRGFWHLTACSSMETWTSGRLTGGYLRGVSLDFELTPAETSIP